MHSTAESRLNDVPVACENWHSKNSVYLVSGSPRACIDRGEGLHLYKDMVYTQ